MWHYCTRTHHQEIWTEIQPKIRYGYCHGCHEHHYWL